MTDPNAADADAELAELLNAQAEFYKSGKPAAARVTRGAPPRVARRPVEPPLPVLNPDAAPTLPAAPTAANKVASSAPVAPPVVTEIVEREPSVGLTLPQRSPSRAAFPRPAHRSQLPADTSSRLRFGRSESRDSTRPQDGGAGVSSGRGMALGSKDAQGIAEENAAKIGSMSVSEIAKAQAELRAQLDPQLVARIQQRRSQPPQSTAAPTSQAPSAPPGALPPAPPLPARPPPSLPLRPPSAPSVTFPSGGPAAAGLGDGAGAEELEALKREWMGDAPDEPPRLDEAKFRRSAEEALEAATRTLGLHDVRFDLGGEVIDAARAATIDVKQGLHHHGDAPAAPGYTLAELSHLCRSSVPAQRSQALLAVGAVLRRASQPAQAAAAMATARAVSRWCRDADTALLLRVALDDGHLSCVHAALDAADALCELMGTVPLAAIVADAARAATAYRGHEGTFGGRPPPAAASAADGGGGEDGKLTDAEVCRRSTSYLPPPYLPLLAARFLRRLHGPALPAPLPTVGLGAHAHASCPCP